MGPRKVYSNSLNWIAKAEAYVAKNSDIGPINATGKGSLCYETSKEVFGKADDRSVHRVYNYFRAKARKANKSVAGDDSSNTDDVHGQELTEEQQAEQQNIPVPDAGNETLDNTADHAPEECRPAKETFKPHAKEDLSDLEESQDGLGIHEPAPEPIPKHPHDTLETELEFEEEGEEDDDGEWSDLEVKENSDSDKDMAARRNLRNVHVAQQARAPRAARQGGHHAAAAAIAAAAPVAPPAPPALPAPPAPPPAPALPPPAPAAPAIDAAVPAIAAPAAAAPNAARPQVVADHQEPVKVQQRPVLPTGGFSFNINSMTHCTFVNGHGPAETRNTEPAQAPRAAAAAAAAARDVEGFQQDLPVIARQAQVNVEALPQGLEPARARQAQVNVEALPQGLEPARARQAQVNVEALPQGLEPAQAEVHLDQAQIALDAAFLDLEIAQQPLVRPRRGRPRQQNQDPAPDVANIHPEAAENCLEEGRCEAETTPSIDDVVVTINNIPFNINFEDQTRLMMKVQERALNANGESQLGELLFLRGQTSYELHVTLKSMVNVYKICSYINNKSSVDFPGMHLTATHHVLNDC